MRMILRLFLSMVFLPTMLFAAGGVTMQYGADVANLKDGDVFYADRHYRAPLDTIKKTINGLLGNSNISSTANIAVTKLDSTGRLSMDSVIANKGIRTAGIATVDSLKSLKGVSASKGNFSGTVKVDSLATTKGVYVGGAVGVGVIPTRVLDVASNSEASASIETLDSTGSAYWRHASNAGSMVLQQFGSAASGTTFGVNRAGWSVIRAATSNGLMIGHASNFPMFFATGNIERLRITADGAFSIPSIATPTAPAVSATQFYVKGSKIIFEYNDGGTVRWKYLDLSGVGVTWQQTTSAP